MKVILHSPYIKGFLMLEEETNPVAALSVSLCLLRPSNVFTDPPLPAWVSKEIGFAAVMLPLGALLLPSLLIPQLARFPFQ